MSDPYEASDMSAEAFAYRRGRELCADEELHAKTDALVVHIRVLSRGADGTCRATIARDVAWFILNELAAVDVGCPLCGG